MVNIKIDINACYYWNEMLKDERTKLLSNLNFWCGLCNYKYKYLPEELKVILRSRID